MHRFGEQVMPAFRNVSAAA